MYMNIFAIIKLMRPQPGKVKIQVSTISFTTPKLMAEIRFTAPTPMMALVFVWVVDTGIPEQAGIKKAEGAGYVGGKALVPLQLYHVHAHGFNDLFSAHAGSQGHDHAA